MSRHDPLVTLKQLLDFVVEARSLASGRIRSELGKEPAFTRATERLLTLMGEAAVRLPAEMRATESAVPWSKIIGMRNRVVHDYGHVDFEIVWETVQTHLPLLFKELEAFFAERGDG